jgi:hypothetical protein
MKRWWRGPRMVALTSINQYFVGFNFSGSEQPSDPGMNYIQAGRWEDLLKS